MRTLLWLGTMVCTLSSAAAVAQNADQTVDLTLAGQAGELRALEATISGLLGEVQVRLRVTHLPAIDPRAVIEPPPEPLPALARVWVAVEQRHAFVYLADAAWERVLVRRIPLEGGLDEVGREQVAQIVRTAIEALLAGAQIGLSRQRASEQLGITPPPQPADTAPAAESTGTTAPPPEQQTMHLRTEFHLRYAARLWGNGPVVQHMPGLRMGVRLGRGRVTPVVLVGARYRLPITVDTGSLLVEVRGVDMQLAAGVDVRLGGDTAARLAAGVLLEFTSSEHRAAGTPGVTAGPRLEFMTPMLSLEVAIVQAVTPWLRLLASVGTDLDILDTRYLVDADVIADPWRLRPFVAVGAAWTP